MQLPELPKIAAVEVVPAQPTEADRAAIAHMGLKQPKAVYVVKVRLKAKPPVTSMGWALYVGDERVSQYWEYKDGIYFVVFDPSSSSRTRANAYASRRTTPTSSTPMQSSRRPRLLPTVTRLNCHRRPMC